MAWIIVILSYGNENGEEAFDSVARLNEQGNLKFDWTTVDKVYDILMEHGIRPIVETIYMPTCIQKKSETLVYAEGL